MFNKKKSSGGSKLPLHTILRLSKELGAERMSKNAAQLLCDNMVERMEKIIQDAARFSKHAERKTIMKEDIKLAIEKNK